ncbi:MAG: hypothetical protein ABR924_17315 [Terracidiphilus sp.]|jgi:hypothetical protein
MTTEGNAEEIRISGFENGAIPADSLGLSQAPIGQSYLQHYPQAGDALGEPLSIREVARLIGCSAWTVRHGYLPQGLPHFRSGPTGKLVFFRNQVVRWILQQQQRKGGR